MPTSSRRLRVRPASARALSVVVGVALGACDDNDVAEPDTIMWSWSFVDPATNVEVGCPANVPFVELIAYETMMLGGECFVPTHNIVAQDTFACERGKGVLRPLRPMQGCTVANDFTIRVAPRTSEGFVYANEGARVVMPPGEAAEGHTDIDPRRGFIRLTWTIVAADGTTAVACPASSVVRTTLEWNPPGYDCSLGSARLTGVVPGTRDVGVALETAGYPSRRLSYEEVSGVVVAEGVITEVAVTIMRAP